MAKITVKPNIDLEFTFTINESEARALDALSGYNIDAFIKVFKEHLGAHYMEKHENGLRTFLTDIKRLLYPSLDRLDEARKIFEK